MVCVNSPEMFLLLCVYVHGGENFLKIHMFRVIVRTLICCLWSTQQGLEANAV